MFSSVAEGKAKGETTDVVEGRVAMSDVATQGRFCMCGSVKSIAKVAQSGITQGAMGAGSEPIRFAPLLVFLIAASSVCDAKTVTYYYTDPQGTPLATADDEGNILSTADYRPYGAQVSGMAVAGPGYTGHVNDEDSGFVYMQARYYDPIVGRFMSVDPVASEAGVPLRFGDYSYANDNPVVNVDPDGRVPIVTRMKDGSISVNYPVTFAGPENTDANRATFISQVALMSGSYEVNGKTTVVKFEATDVKKGLFTGTPLKARNAIDLVKGATQGLNGTSNAVMGGKNATIRTDDRFDQGVVRHEMLHLGGVDDQKSADGGIIPNNNDIMNTVPGQISSSDVETLINYKGNVQRNEIQ